MNFSLKYKLLGISFNLKTPPQRISFWRTLTDGCTVWNYLPEDNRNDLFALTDGFQSDATPSDNEVIPELIGKPQTIIERGHPQQVC